RRSITRSSQSVIAIASAVRGRPSSRAISPKISPSRTMLNTASRPSGATTPIFTAPTTTPHSPGPGSPLAQIAVPRRTGRFVMYEPNSSITAASSPRNSGWLRIGPSLSVGRCGTLDSGNGLQPFDTAAVYAADVGDTWLGGYSDVADPRNSAA